MKKFVVVLKLIFYYLLGYVVFTNIISLVECFFLVKLSDGVVKYVDLFIKSDHEASDLNKRLSLKEARENYQKFGSVLENLKEYCREPREYERYYLSDNR